MSVVEQLLWWMHAAVACSGTQYREVERFVEGTSEGTINHLSYCSMGERVVVGCNYVGKTGNNFGRKMLEFPRGESGG